MSMIAGAEETWVLYTSLNLPEYNSIFRIFPTVKAVMNVYAPGREKDYAAAIWAKR
jgi:hypothetical protein